MLYKIGSCYYLNLGIIFIKSDFYVWSNIITKQFININENIDENTYIGKLQ
jgi:hypothetical protein